MLNSFNLPDRSPMVLGALVFSWPMMFLTVKSWVTATSLVLFLFLLFSIVLKRRFYCVERDRNVWIFAFVLAAPFLTEVIAHAGRGSFEFALLDGPSRALIASVLLIYLTRHQSLPIQKILGLGSAFGISGIFISVIFFQEYYWAGRMATYFVDPITLPCYTVALAGLVIFSELPGRLRNYENFVKSAAMLMTAYIALGSHSRSGWVALVALCLLYIFIGIKVSRPSKIIACATLVSLLFVIYSFVDIVHIRIDEVFVEFSKFVDGELVSSVGQRLGMGVLDLHLIMEYPFFGVTDATLPAYETLVTAMPILTEETYNVKVLAGSHSEILDQLVRRGVIFGGLSLFCMFAIPIYIFSKYSKFEGNRGVIAKMGLGLTVPILFSSLTIQVFNLKMTITFYCLMLTLIYAHLLFDRQKGPLSKH